MEDFFIKAVNDGDVIMARILLKGEVLVDPRLVRFKEMQQYAESRLPDLYEEHDGESFAIPETQWSDELHGKIQKDLNGNFSKERLYFYAKMAPVVLKSKVEELQQEEPIDSDTEKKNNEEKLCHQSDITESKSYQEPSIVDCQMEDTFVKAVNDGDVIMVRILLKGEILVDPRLVRFKEMQQCAEFKLPDLYEDHDGESFDVPETLWTDELHGKIQKDLNRNFSKERLDFYAKMAPVVLKCKIDELQQNSKVLELVNKEPDVISVDPENYHLQNNSNDSDKDGDFDRDSRYETPKECQDDQCLDSNVIKVVVAGLVIGLGVALLLS